MVRLRPWLLAGCALLAAVPALAADRQRAKGPADVAARIDAVLAKDWQDAKVKPAAPADDAEFCRRVYLDLAGRIPSVAEVRAFLDDRRPDKRAKLVEQLLDSPRYVTHFTNVYRGLLLPEADANFQVRLSLQSMEGWLRKHLRENTPYDKVIRDLLTTPVAAGGPRGIGLLGQGEASAAGFYTAKEMKPENIAAATSRLFLGVKLECAQCHKHPFAEWEREQFWSLAAFFAGIEARQQGDFVIPGAERAERRELTIPGTEKVVQAGFLDGTKPQWKDKEKVNARQTLAEWVTTKENPYFARATANRMWAHFFGSGIIDPVDEMVGSHNEPSHPAVLDELAKGFADADFDLKFLLRAITATKAYQLTSATSDKSQDDPTHFARQRLRGLSAEQLWDSLETATGFREAGPTGGRPLALGRGGSVRTEFLSRFTSTGEQQADQQTSILQALALMNGRFTRDATNLERSETLAAVLDAPFLDAQGRIEALYLSTLSRKPSSAELARVEKFIARAVVPDDGKPVGQKQQAERYKQAMADVLWALLNSGEFYLNH